jgi:CubicO group peptidase (beta-lactamase class C family)
VAGSEELVPAVSLAYALDGEIVTAGWRAEPDRLFQAASISKPVAALLALCLVADGELSLDDDIANAMHSWSLPPLETGGGASPQTITLRLLLCHGAGLGVHGFPGYARGERIPTLLDILDGRPPANSGPIFSERPPGLAAVYSGGGYTVLQQLIEDVSQRPFADVAAERVLAPLGMESATFEQPLPPELEPQVAPAFSAGRQIEGGWHVYPELAAAGLWCTPTDLVHFARGVQRAFDGQRGAVIPQRLAAAMMTPHFRGRGLGVALYGTPQDPHFGHTGGNAGYRCELFASAHHGPTAAVMTNSDEGGELVPALLNHLAPHLGWSAETRQELDAQPA